MKLKRIFKIYIVRVLVFALALGTYMAAFGHSGGLVHLGAGWNTRAPSNELGAGWNSLGAPDELASCGGGFFCPAAGWNS